VTPGYLSNQMPRTYATKPEPAVRYWIKNNLKPAEIDVLELVERRARYSFVDLPRPVKGAAIQQDARRDNYWRPKKEYRWVITSPPYWGMRSYWPDQWLRNWFLGGPAEVMYTHADQITHMELSAYIDDLSKVWKNCAAVCAPQARLVIRFGALPSQPIMPAEILEESLRRAGCGWKVVNIEDAGCPSGGRRQSDQFTGKKAKPINEIDLYAVLEV
jgi:hypothetical protein